ncbi:Phosphatidylinositol N-acetylglucosaminyltransferase subunit P [Vanrija pseudolonga]|uniref:Phosphatidylinositol N-acetylglucosaminyltransferase subunit P n=1 Tax=Vanrija pseudolonga TaxID=143232 RepID=A0AAF0Y5Q1_9TREE|nr:Phosphatidylinositol N-acetylglucosaminyltransferase subunit P [Vanrija pseudolonga]
MSTTRRSTRLQLSLSKEEHHSPPPEPLTPRASSFPTPPTHVPSRRASTQIDPLAAAAAVQSPLDPISPWPPTSTISDDDASPSSANTPRDDLPSAKEVYGSLAILLTYLLFAVYLLWAFAPPAWLDAVGWTWYPAREWAVVVPCWLMVVVLLAYWSYAGLTVFLTPAFTSATLITDKYANIPADDSDAAERYYAKFTSPTAVPEAVDLPIDLVNRVLYPPRPRQRPRSDATP